MLGTLGAPVEDEGAEHQPDHERGQRLVVTRGRDRRGHRLAVETRPPRRPRAGSRVESSPSPTSRTSLGPSSPAQSRPRPPFHGRGPPRGRRGRSSPSVSPAATGVTEVGRVVVTGERQRQDLRPPRARAAAARSARTREVTPAMEVSGSPRARQPTTSFSASPEPPPLFGVRAPPPTRRPPPRASRALRAAAFLGRPRADRPCPRLHCRHRRTSSDRIGPSVGGP